MKSFAPQIGLPLYQIQTSATQTWHLLRQSPPGCVPSVKCVVQKRNKSNCGRTEQHTGLEKKMKRGKQE